MLEDDGRVTRIGPLSRKAMRRASKRTLSLAAMRSESPSPSPQCRGDDGAGVRPGKQGGTGRFRRRVAEAKGFLRALTNRAKGPQAPPDGHEPSDWMPNVLPIDLQPGESFSTFDVCIGDARFTVPKGWYLMEGYEEVVTREEVLQAVWPEPMARYSSGRGLTEAEIGALWGCIDLVPTDGLFWRDAMYRVGTIDTLHVKHVGGYAGWGLWWMTQFMAMFWEFSRAGELYAGEPNNCTGVSGDATEIFGGTIGIRLNVIGDGKNVPKYLSFTVHGDCDGCASTAVTCWDMFGWVIFTNDVSTEWEFVQGVQLPASDSTAFGVQDDLARVGYFQNYSRRAIAATVAAYSLAPGCIWGVFALDVPWDPDVVDYAGTGFFDSSLCSVYLQAAQVGVAGFKSDFYLHFAHVALALSRRAGTEEAAEAFEYAAIMLGRYAANAIVDGCHTAVHEFAHAYRNQSTGHLADQCCVCSVRFAWLWGVKAHLGLPVGTESCYADFERVSGSRYETVLYPRMVHDAPGCSTEYGVSGPVNFSYAVGFYSPGEPGGSTSMYSWGCE